MPINNCPNCGDDSILKESYYQKVEFVICEICEWSFYITDAGDADNYDIDRMQRKFQEQFESQVRGFESTQSVLARLGYVQAMQEPPKKRTGHVAYTYPNDYEKRMKIV